jgi:dTDP-4-amino-4,6-dideoxygalactose transaminase
VRVAMRIPFNKPYMTGKELSYISQAHAKAHLAGDGEFTKKCNQWLERQIGCQKALLTHSCTAALEMAAILADIKPGDEVIMPSYTFVSTANAFVLRGGIPVFVDVRPDTLNIDETRIEAAITARTRAIVPVHYAGVACEMDAIMAIASRHGLLVIEDAAQGIMSFHKRRPLGSIGHMAALSFHETKNIISGEGGALLINDPQFVERAEIVREKGTNRSLFFRGQVDKYTWVDIGSSFLPGELAAAFLWAQMEEAADITSRRLGIWNTYHEGLAHIEQAGLVRRPVVPAECRHNGHMYYLLLPDLERRTRFIAQMRRLGIDTVFHYVPLHDSPHGAKTCRVSGGMEVTQSMSERVVRLPFWLGLENEQNAVIEAAIGAMRETEKIRQ